MGAHSAKDHMIAFLSGRYYCSNFTLSLQNSSHILFHSYAYFLAVLGVKYLFCFVLFLQYWGVERRALCMLDVLDKPSTTGIYPSPCFYFFMNKTSIHWTSSLKHVTLSSMYNICLGNRLP